MAPDERQTVLLISGMRDNRCRERIAAALESLPGVREVELNLYRARAVIIHDARSTPLLLMAAVERAGYGAATHPEEAHRSPGSAPPATRTRIGRG